MIEGNLSCKEAWCEELAGALAIEVKLAPGEERKLTVILGSFDTETEKDRLIRKVLPGAYRLAAWNRLMHEKETMLEAVRVETPDEQVNRLVNIWSKQQIQLCVEFGRDGARGFREHPSGCVGNRPSFRPRLPRPKSRKHWDTNIAMGMPSEAGPPLQPHHYSDGPAWIAPTVAAYLKETGDRSFMDEQVPYLDKGEATVLEHTLTGIRHLSTDLGAHGLVLAHEGDWNDSLNWMGRAGKGESVWTRSSRSIIPTCDCRNGARVSPRLLARRAGNEGLRIPHLPGAIEEHGWDGKWYLAGWSDYGNPVGSSANKEGRIYLNTQTWAVLTGLATGERKELCLKAVDEMLESDHGSLTLWPHYTAADENVGRVTMLLPGMYENSTPYCHGTAFKIVADIIAGRPDEALRSWRKVMPDNPGHPSIVSGCEPYAFTNQYLGPANGRAGDSISGWITGTAGWMFRAVLEYFCGIKPGYLGYRVQPCFPSEWDRVHVSRTLRGKTHEIKIERSSGGYDIEVDGARYAGGTLPY